jgi:DNA segregation ATPase ftsK/spoIIIE
MPFFGDEYDKDSSLEAYRAGKNPPEFGAGQGDDDLFAPVSSNDSFVSGGGGFDDFMNPSPGGAFGGGSGFGGGFGEPNGGQPQKKSEDEIILDILAAIWKQIKNFFVFLKDLASTFKDTTPHGWLMVYNRLAIFGAFLSGAGVVVLLLGLFVPSIANSGFILALGIITGGIGVSGMVIYNQKAKDWISETGQMGDTYSNLRPADSEGGMPMVEPDELVEEEPVDDFSSYEDSNDFGFAEEDSDLGGWDFEEDDSDDDGFVDLSSQFEDDDILVADEPVDIDEAIASLSDAGVHAQSRAYLYEQFYKVLRSVTPNYSELTELEEYSDDFQHYLTLLLNAAAREGFTDQDFQIEHIYENSFMYKIVISASPKFKADKVAISIENQEKFNQMGIEVKPNLFVTSKVIGHNVHIDIIKDSSPMLTVKDMWSENKDFILDPDNVMPVVLGSDELGQSIVMDFAKINSIALSGKPGKGKTWLAQSIIAQLAFFSTPNEVQFIFADPKGQQGDFANINFPHVIEKVKTEEETMEVLRRIVREEVPKREALLGQYGLTDIKDMHKMYPDVTMPYLYILVEEMMSLGDHLKQMDKEAYKEYRAILSDIVNKCRYLGIRLFGLSQRMTDNAIPKDIKVGIDLKLTAGADASEIEQVMEVKPKDFPYNIAGKVGKYAVMSPEYRGGNASFMVGAVMGTSNPENAQTYRFVKALWEKIEPRKEEKSAKQLVEYELGKASSTEMDDILNASIELW